MDRRGFIGLVLATPVAAAAAQMPALSVIGRGSSTSVMVSLTGTDGQVLRLCGTSIKFVDP